ncbi:UDP-N-acetylglucosamine pyrophosphorylase [Aurantimonas manganoxydans SI85-9A1]|uniref:Bifunctional protein GlmU n=2 Tax=Aurantimonas manganoxydans TaxID=651183 RepID=Q1YHX7_AURMS|nr:bifunctional UDP-N-acetylglucosamine diphosphorylase/glucosamine-1-phosphate N-acetyltransferase GlmU [Aurantimonas manganoxydans]EAS50340.1 UDP-N-acetylglucosamine pyrophosphorylase [Aurantimonas manganoxydans SI85-9A1]
MARRCLSIILAAGEGTRMRSSKSKVLHKVAGLEMIRHVVRAARAAGSDDVALVVGRDGTSVADAARREIASVAAHEQTERLGTGHAVLAAREALAQGFDDILVLFGDTPLIGADTLARARETLAEGADVCVVGFRPLDPTGYGRLIEAEGELVAIREEKDADAEERRVGFCNAGVMAFRGDNALAMLDAIGNANAKGEYYLTDLVAIARAAGCRVRAIEADASEVLGVNTREELAQVEALWQGAWRRQVMLSGVTLQDPGSVFFSHDTELEPDVFVEPQVVFGPGVRVEAGATIHAFSHLEGCHVGPSASVGPFARLRPGADLAQGAKVGNFCEVKNAEIGVGAKVNHLSYIGDTSVGAAANIGAGTITCNYDGALKHRTEIGAGSFIGSNSALVAPVRIGEGAYVGTGSVVTDDVPDGALAIARERQVTKPGRGREIAERNRAAKAAKAAGKA